ncbi:MAG: helix-turn-helix domain-containing protein [Plesiomonas sp.]
MNRSKNPLELISKDPVELSIISFKARLMMIISHLIREKGFNQSEAAEFLGVTQPRVSNLMNGKLSKFSIDMLIEMMGKFGYLFDVTFNANDDNNPVSLAVKKSAV